MPETSDRIISLSVTQIVARFRDALVAIYPIAVDLDLLENDEQPYDDYDEVAECLFKVLVERSLASKYAVETGLALPRYGFYGLGASASFLQVKTQNGLLRFVEFCGDRSFGPEPFNAIGAETHTGAPVRVRYSADIEFEWSRPSAG